MLNDGAMNFAVDTTGRLPSLPCDGFVLGDWDQDGDLDAYMLGGISLPFVPGDDAVFENDGTGSFTDVSAQALPAAVRSVSGDVADFDGDGIVDILLSNGLLSTQAPRVRILLGQPGGGFRVSTAVPPSPFVITVSARFVDIDGDGDLDVVAASSLVLENVGGVLVDITASSLPSGAFLSPLVLVGDVDEDGDQDLVAGQQLLINDGTGVFALDSARLPASSDALFIGDLDRDGDLDLGLSDDLWLNHDRHIDVIRVPRVGASFGIEVHRQPGYGAGAGIALLGHADAPAAVATAIPGVGLLLLDVGTLQIPFSVAIDGSGTGMLQIQVPAQPALRGLEFWFQAGILRPGTANRLTNMERIRIE